MARSKEEEGEGEGVRGLVVVVGGASTPQSPILPPGAHPLEWIRGE